MALSLTALAGAGLVTAGPVGAPAAAAATPRVTAVQAWQRQLTGKFVLSSPIPDTVNGVASVVVGSINGRVYALSLRTGAEAPRWPVATPGLHPVDSTPSINGTTVYVGTGDAAHPAPGGYLAINSRRGSRLWYRQIPRTKGGSSYWGVQASMAVGSMNGTKSVVAGTLGQFEGAFHASTGSTMRGFPWFAADSEFSTPSLANLYGNGRNYVVEGGDSTRGFTYATHYTNGGHIRVLKATGSSGYPRGNEGLVCQSNTNQGIESSPAVGPFLGGGATGIVVGTGDSYQPLSRYSDSDKVIALTSHCQRRWTRKLNGDTRDSPALVSALGGRSLQVAEGTSHGTTGTVYLLRGNTGSTVWARNVAGMVVGGITSANLGAGHQDLLVPTTHGLYVLDGVTGRQVPLGVPQPLGAGKVAIQSSPAVTDDYVGGKHVIGVTVAGYNAHGGEVMHWNLTGTDGYLAAEKGAWPMFHHDPQLTGTTLRPGR